MKMMTVMKMLQTFLHELRDNIDGLLLGDHGIKAHQLVVLEALHQVGFCHEGLHGHAAGLHGLHRHFRVLIVHGCEQTRVNRLLGRRPGDPERGTHPSRLLQTGPLPASSPVSGRTWGSPRHPSPTVSQVWG